MQQVRTKLMGGVAAAAAAVLLIGGLAHAESASGVTGEPTAGASSDAFLATADYVSENGFVVVAGEVEISTTGIVRNSLSAD